MTKIYVQLFIYDCSPHFLLPSSISIFISSFSKTLLSYFFLSFSPSVHLHFSFLILQLFSFLITFYHPSFITSFYSSFCLSNFSPASCIPHNINSLCSLYFSFHFYFILFSFNHLFPISHILYVKCTYLLNDSSLSKISSSTTLNKRDISSQTHPIYMVPGS